MDRTKTPKGATRRKSAKPAAGKRAKRPPEGPLDPVRESLDLLDQGISVVDGDLDLVYANQKFIDLLGFPRELCVPGTPFADFIRFNAERGEYGPGDVEEIVREHVERAKRREPHLFERARPDGSAIEVRGTPLPGGGFVTTYTDITERKRAEEAFRESEAQFRGIFRQSPLGMAFVTLEFRYAGVNDTYCEMLGYREAEFKNMSFRDITHPEDMEKSVELSEKLFRGEIPHFQIEKRYIKKNKDVVVANFTGTVVCDDAGKPVYGLAMIEDITERKKTEEALRESERDVRTILDNMSDTFYRTDAEGRIILASRSVAELLGQDGTELIGKNLADLYVEPDGRTEFLRALEKGGGRISDYEALLRRKDGTEVWVSTNAHKLFDADGKFIGIEGTSRDNTLRKHAETALRESEQRYQEIFDNMPLPVWMKDADSRYILVNKEYERWFAMDRERILGKTISEIVPDANWEEFAAEDELVLRTDAVYGAEKRMCFPDGVERDYLISKFPVMGPDGRFFAAGLISADITERKAAERELARYRDELEELVEVRTRDLRQEIADRERAEGELNLNERRLRAVLDNIVDGIITIDERGTVESVSAVAERLFGYQASEVIGRNVSMLMPEPFHSEHDGYLSRYLSTGEARIIGYGREVEGRRKDGSTFPMELGVSEVDLEGRRIFTGIVRDITERKRAEGALRQAQKLEGLAIMSGGSRAASPTTSTIFCCPSSRSAA